MGLASPRHAHSNNVSPFALLKIKQGRAMPESQVFDVLGDLALLIGVYLIWNYVSALHERVEVVVRDRLLGQGQPDAEPEKPHSESPQ